MGGLAELVGVTNHNRQLSHKPLHCIRIKSWGITPTPLMTELCPNEMQTDRTTSTDRENQLDES